MVSSGKATRSAPESTARFRASAILSTFPQMSPTVVLIWASATLIPLNISCLARSCPPIWYGGPGPHRGCRVPGKSSGERSPVLAQSEPQTGEIEDRAEQTIEQASAWVERLARLGYVAKGVVYAAIGFLALRETLGVGGETTDPTGVMQLVATQPLGGLMLALLAVGLACYALWKVVQGAADPDGKGSDAHGLVRRIGYVGSGVIYGVLAFTATQSIFGAEDTSEDALAASVMALQPPLGPILVFLAGTIVIGVGLYQIYAAYKA